MVNYFLYIIALTSLSQAGNIARWSEALPDQLGFWRLSLAALFIFPVALKIGNFNKHLKENKKDFLWVIIAAFFFFLHLWTYMFAAQNTQIAHGMILYAINPLFTSFGAYLFFKEKFSWNLALSYFLAFSSIIILVTDKISSHSPSLKGDLSAIISALFFSIYLLSSKKARQKISNTSYAFVKYFFTGIFFGLFAVYQNVPLHIESNKAWLAIFALIIFPTFLGHALISYLMKHLNVNWMSCGKLLEPGMSAIVAFILFGETISTKTIVAFTFTVFAVISLFYPVLFPNKKS